MHSCGTGPNVIGERQATAPCGRRHRALDGSQQRLGIRIGNRQDGDFCYGFDLFEREPLCIRSRTNARREGIARINRHIQHAATLDAESRTRRTIRIRVPGHVPVTAGIGINKAADSSMFGRQLRFDSAPGLAVTHDDNCVFHRNTQPLELFVIRRDTVIDINQRRGHVAIPRVGVVSGKLFLLLIAGGVDAERRLLEFGLELRGCYQLYQTFFRGRKERVKLFDAGIQPPRPKLG